MIIYLFVFICAGSSLLHSGSSLVMVNGGYSLVVVRKLLIVASSLAAGSASRCRLQ